MEKEVVKHHHQQHQQHQQHNSHNNNNNNTSTTTTTNLRERHIIGEGLIRPPHSADFVLRWGNRKRLRCMKIQVKDETAPAAQRTTVRRVRSDNNNNNNNNNSAVNGVNHPSNGHFNLRQRSASPANPPPRILRNSESGSGMKGHSNYHQTTNGGGGGGGVRGLLASPERGGGDRKGGGGGGGGHHNHHHENNNNNMINGGRAGSSEKGGSSSGGGGGGSGEVVVWPPKFMIALTNKEKEEDFMAIKGSKLPQRPKKRAKFVQRTLNLVSPGGWLCDLTLERYEVREKKTSRKRPRGLKAMGNYIESDSE